MNVRITEPGGDHNKLYVIHKMSAMKIEKWALRALLALIAAGAEIPEGFEDLGAAGLAELGLKSLGGMKAEALEPLLDEMMNCVEIIPDPKKPQVARPLDEGQNDIEEVTTLFELRKEWWRLHMGFLQTVVRSTSQK